MKSSARLVVLFLALAMLAACARLKADTTTPTLYDVHSQESNAALWGAGD
jgi:uncharacterized lipoprotein